MVIVFSSLEFLFRFMPIFLIFYYMAPSKYRNAVLLIGSIIFYTIGEPYYVLLLGASIGVNYLLAKKISFYTVQHRWMKRKRKDWLVTALLIDAGLLIVFKLVSAFMGSAVLPLGLSFFTFKMISFQVDIYKEKIGEVPTLNNAALYMCMFPQIVSGPIMRYNEEDFLEERRQRSFEKLEEGLQYFVIGLAVKVLLADRLAILWKDIGMIGYESISTPLSWLGAAGYSMQLYFDFWGYSLMASGIGVMLGFPFIVNFNHPYASRSISEFWRRWHMTLGSFFRDYVYIPLGGSRESNWITVFNLLIVWALTGIWHGGSLNFILWGFVLFLFIVLEKIFLGKWLLKYPPIARVYVLFVIPVTWILFAVTDLSQLVVYLGRMFPFIGGEGIAVNTDDIWKYLNLYGGFLAAGVVCCIPSVYRLFEKYRKHPIVICGCVILFWWSVYLITSSQNNPFMYLKF